MLCFSHILLDVGFIYSKKKKKSLIICVYGLSVLGSKM